MSPGSTPFAKYLDHARQREQQRRGELERLRERAWGAARRAAQILRDGFGAKRIILFGSLASPKRFHAGSDVDLAIDGPLDERFFKAVAAVLAATDELDVDVVHLDDCSEALRQLVDWEGIDL